MTLPSTVRVYVNEQGVSVSPGASALDAVRVLYPDLAVAIAAGTMQLTDSRGLPVSADVIATGGAIFRVVPVRDRPEAAS